MARSDPPVSDITVFGVASNGTVPQWDGHLTPVGVLLRWFVRPELGYPELGFHVYRAIVSDVPPLPFDDLNVPFINGRKSWTYANQITLSCADGLSFVRGVQIGWWRLVLTGKPVPLVVRFASPAWLVQIRADADTTDLHVIGKANSLHVQHATLTAPGDEIEWRTRGIEELEITGTGSISFIRYHLLGDAASWQLLGHRCLPVVDPAYRCGPLTAAREADEARSRLPAKVATEWTSRFHDAFTNLLPALRRLATGRAGASVPAASTQSDVRLSVDEQQLIALLTLDPHSARILGLAFDDPLSGTLNGVEYIYKVVGRWLGKPIQIQFVSTTANLDKLRDKYGLDIQIQVGATSTGIHIRFPQMVYDVVFRLNAGERIEWMATDTNGKNQTGVGESGSNIHIPAILEIQLSIGATAPSDIVMQLRWTPTLDRLGILPGIIAVEPGAPSGPNAITAQVVTANSPSAIATANLDWPLSVKQKGSIPEGEVMCYQVGHRRLSSDPTTPVANPSKVERTDLLYNGSPIYIGATQAQQPFGQRILHCDRNEGAGLSAGRWGWWVRGVDLFGRVSDPSPWTQQAVLDLAPPPAPVLVESEWVQRALPASTVAAFGRSTEANRWLHASQAPAGLIASWVYGPDQADQHPDVDGFRLYVRRPSATTQQYLDPWPAPLASLGPTTLQTRGSVTAAPVLNPTLSITITSIQPLPPPPDANASTPLQSACTTDLTLDGASSVFVGGTLSIGANSFSVVANGDGTALSIVVSHTAANPPATGSGILRAPSGRLLQVVTNVPALPPPTGLRARAGLLVIGSGTWAQRLPILHVIGGTFLCRTVTGANVASGDSATWFPVWSVAFDDTGFGPLTSETTPVAHAQVAVRAVRHIQTHGPESALSAPLTVTAVDITVPPPPTMSAITFDPAQRCAVLASRADWYGKSRFELHWTAQPTRQFTVYRALGDEIIRLDQLEYAKGGRRVNNFPQTADWPPGVGGDPIRRNRVTVELAAIATAHAVADPAEKATALDAAYRVMTIDTQILLARQDYATGAFVALNGQPTNATGYMDELDGRTHAHWFYRVTSRTAGGMESALSEPSPPICCPDVVAPAAPLVHMALAGPGFVKLRWLASPDTDLDHYDIYASKDPTAVAELATMTPVESWVPENRVGGVVFERSVSCEPGEWCFWIVAVDTSENRSGPSAMLRGKSLVPPPEAPVWVAISREPATVPDHVALSWSHPTNQRLACLVERRPIEGSFWESVSGWLARGVYQFDDIPSDLNGGWEYRLRVRDHFGQDAASMPVLALAAQ